MLLKLVSKGEVDHEFCLLLGCLLCCDVLSSKAFIANDAVDTTLHRQLKATRLVLYCGNNSFELLAGQL